MLTYIDNFLNKTTMYRLVLYYLAILLGLAFILSLFGLLPFSPWQLLISTFFLLAVSLLANGVFAFTFAAIPNLESVYITALILALIISPAKSLADLWFLFWAAVWAMASKYIFALSKKHFFNPVAFAIALTAITINQSASWWVGTLAMLPLVLLGGTLIVRKIRRFDLVYYFLLASVITIFGLSILKGGDLITVARKTILDSPLLFFAFVMLTEPLTTPPTKQLQMAYGALVGVLVAPQFHLGSLFFSPEQALLVGNIFSYFVSPKQKVILRLKEKRRVAPDIMDFIFQNSHSLAFVPGQYLEWTLPANHPDNRGNRRYFTIASSPTEPNIRMGVKFYEGASSFKKTLLSLRRGDAILAGQLAGDFTLQQDPNQKLVLIAGGIGITPFRSMIKYLVDTKQKRDIVLFYANKTVQEIVYVDVFNQAATELGVRTIYALSDLNNIPADWNGIAGRIDENVIAEQVPDYKERIFYLSGPHAMVTAFLETLTAMGVPTSRIKTDYFPGFA